MNIAIVYILIAVAGSAVGQILLKMGMNKMGPLTLTVNEFIHTLWRMLTNPYVVVGLGIYVLGTVFWLAALSRVDLSFAYPFASLSYIIMLVASALLFKEEITPMRLAGTLVVGVGVLLISRS